jgi:hypothetical protein
LEALEEPMDKKKRPQFRSLSELLQIPSSERPRRRGRPSGPHFKKAPPRSALVDLVDRVMAEAKSHGITEKHGVAEICKRLSKRGPKSLKSVWRDYESGSLETLYWRQKKIRGNSFDAQNAMPINRLPPPIGRDFN